MSQLILIWRKSGPVHLNPKDIQLYTVRFNVHPCASSAITVNEDIYFHSWAQNSRWHFKFKSAVDSQEVCRLSGRPGPFFLFLYLRALSTILHIKFSLIVMQNIVKPGKQLCIVYCVFWGLFPSDWRCFFWEKLEFSMVRDDKRWYCFLMGNPVFFYSLAKSREWQSKYFGFHCLVWKSNKLSNSPHRLNAIFPVNEQHKQNYVLLHYTDVVKCQTSVIQVNWPFRWIFLNNYFICHLLGTIKS